MEDSVVVKKKFILTESQFKEISDYTQGLSKTFALDDLEIEYNNFKWIIEFLGDINNKINIICSLYKGDKIYKSSYAIIEPNNIYNVFRQDTKFKSGNLLKKEAKEDVELYFTFNIEHCFKDCNYYLDIINSINVQGSFTNAIGMFNYFSLDNEINLFLCLFALLCVRGQVAYHYYKYRLTKKEDITYKNLEFIKDKLDYFGYNQGYLDEYDEISTDNIYKALNAYDLASNEIFECFMVCVLKLLLHQEEHFLLDNSKFFKVAKDYFSRLKLEGKIF